LDQAARERFSSLHAWHFDERLDLASSDGSIRIEHNKDLPKVVTTLAVVEEEQATGAVAEAYEGYRKHFGRQSVPGILKCFATHPPLLEQMISLASTMLFVDGHLSRKVKEMIATQVSALNSCPYCLDSHASFLRSNGGSEDLLLSLSAGQLDDSSISPSERSLLEFAAKVTLESHKISPSDINVLNDAGWDQLAIAEAVHIAGLFAFFNRVANAFGLPSQHLSDLYPASMNSREEQ
jgi:uncharacterized peroxidase-related enzyme